MAGGSRQDPGSSDRGATEPITLTDPDGAVTRVAPWSSWTREQVRAPGGEPALVTRLDQGQLWFSAGRRRSPWRHEVHVGPAIVSTPRGRFQAVAESDGGATISCLAGRTRVVAGLREPVLLGPDQSAAVSSDGRTLVVMDREAADGTTVPVIIDLTDDADEVVEGAEVPREVEELAAIGAHDGGGRPLAVGVGSSLGEESIEEVDPVPSAAAEDGEPRPARLGWIPELVAVAALVMVLVSMVWVFSTGGDDTDTAAPITEAPTEPTSTDVATTAAPTTSTPTTQTTAATTQTTQTTLPPLAAGASAQGELQSCRRSEGGVTATVLVTHRGGPASSFDVTAALVDAAGATYATGTVRSPLIEPDGSAEVEVPVAFDGRPEGSCELVSVVGG